MPKNPWSILIALSLAACGTGPLPEAESADPQGLLRACWYWYDADGDGFGGASRVRTPGCLQPPGYVRNPLDCDDASAAVHPGAFEVCNDADDDCDGDVDLYALDEQVWYRDADGDGFGRWALTQLDCDQPVGYAATYGDCADTNPSRNPGATETCNGADDDCDGHTDDNDPDTVGQTWWYQDLDGDGYGTPASAVLACASGGGAPTADDCDDADAGRSPGAAEVPFDTIDQDCDGSIAVVCGGVSLFEEDFDSASVGTDLTAMGWSMTQLDPPNVRRWEVSSAVVDDLQSASAESSAGCCGYHVYGWDLPAYELLEGDLLEVRGVLQVSDTFLPADSESVAIHLYDDFLLPTQKYFGVSLSGLNARVAWSDTALGQSGQSIDPWTDDTVAFRVRFDAAGNLDGAWRPVGDPAWIPFTAMTPTPFLPTTLYLQAERTGWGADSLSVRVVRADDTDEDGTCDSLDQCPGFDDLVDVDHDGIPDGC